MYNDEINRGNSKMTDTTVPDIMPPHSEAAEEAVLGSILINERAMHEIGSFLKPVDFFMLKNGYVYEAMQRLNARSEPVSLLTLSEELREQQRLDDIGGLARLAQLGDMTATSVDIEAYGRIVERAALRRKMLAASDEISRLAMCEDEDVYTCWEKGSQIYSDILPQRYARAGMKTAEEAASDFYDIVENLYVNKTPPGIPTGFADLDKLTSGFHDSDLVILAGRPGMGKTALLVNLIMNIAPKKQCAFFSLEMAQNEVMGRIYSIGTQVNSQKFRRGGLTENEWQSFVSYTMKIKELKLHVDSTPAQTAAQIRAKCLALKNRGQLDLVFVDYLQIMKATDRKAARYEQVGAMASDLKVLARELEVPVVAAAQLSRKCEERVDKKPLLSDLGESGNLERVSDVVMFLYRDEVYNSDDPRTKGTAEIIVAKHRHGPTGAITLHFTPELMRFTNLARDSKDG
jgi:replicative DNA helicase